MKISRGGALVALLAMPAIAFAASDPNDLPDSPLPFNRNLVPTPIGTPTTEATPGAKKKKPPSELKHISRDFNKAPPFKHGLFEKLDVRLEPEVYDYFAPKGKYVNNYGFMEFRTRAALGYTGYNDRWDAKVEMQNIFLGDLPMYSIAPGAAGSLGQGASYYSLAREPNIDTFGIRQAYVRFGAPTGALGTPTGTAVKVGRFDYSSGMEAPSHDLVLDWIKRERISKKVIGQPDYNIFSRSFDGLRFDVDELPVRITGFVARPTQAEPHFATDVNQVLTSNLAVTLMQGDWLPRGEAQIFFNHLDDDRAVPQIDAHPADQKTTIAALGGDHINTMGGDYVSHLGADGDLALWYAHQDGRWGHETQDANAFTAEVGIRFPEVSWEPWLRAGFNYYSGDSDPNHLMHGTFLAELADPRVRYNFFSAANLHDLMAQFMVRPSKDLSARIDFHMFSLDSASDLWYSGSGVAQQVGSNGISGRPSGGQKGLGNQLEFYLQQKINGWSTLQLREVHAFGGPVVKASYPLQAYGNLVFLEYHVTR